MDGLLHVQMTFLLKSSLYSLLSVCSKAWPSNYWECETSGMNVCNVFDKCVIISPLCVSGGRSEVQAGV